MKKIISLLFGICLILALSPFAFAQPPKIVDEADLLTADEELALEEKAQDIVDVYDMDVVILTVDSTNGEFIQDYADDYYDENRYGVDMEYSGVLFMLAMDTREWWISTCGDCMYVLTDYGIQMLFSEIASDLSAGDYYSAFDHYLDELEVYYDEYVNGSPIDGYAPDYDGPGSYEPGISDEIIYYEEPRGVNWLSLIFTSLLIGVIVGAIALWLMSRGMKTAKQQSGAADYVTGGIRIVRRQDFFLYSRTSKTPISQNNNGGGRSGGSSIHRSSSGRSHGGGGGRF